jgi:uncharacterized protein YndB with AHSA1/START domain
MPTNKDFKRLVRARMSKTGEAYTAARARLLARKQPRTTPHPIAVAPDYAKLTGMSDAAIAAKTGCDWQRWVRALDSAGVHDWSHRAIAAYVGKTYRIPGWWTQMVTTGYERIKGLRAIGQRRDGRYEASKSKVFPVPVGRLYRAFHDGRTRRRWLPDVKLIVRTTTRDKTMRVSWPDGSSVELYFVSKGTGKSQVAVQHGRLPDRAAVDRMKAYWTDRLGALQGILTTATRRR